MKPLPKDTRNGLFATLGTRPSPPNPPSKLLSCSPPAVAVAIFAIVIPLSITVRNESTGGSYSLNVQVNNPDSLSCADGCEILVIKPQDIGLLPRENWVYGNNSFLLHGYYNYRYLILARLGKPGERGRYILGVPGHYGNNEKYMAAMFGFDRFVRSTRQPPRDSRFGYWYTDLNFT